MKNLILPSEFALRDKSWTNGLAAVAQTNCQVTLTDNGYRIYRPPNIDSSSWDMCGGIRIMPFHNGIPYLLVKGHTYIIMLDVTGKTSNAIAMFGFSNNMGWEGGGLMPEPSDVSMSSIPENFQGSKTCWYKFTINDDIYKVCTESYAYFVAGTTYLSYKDIKFGFDYTSTGELGTDLYINNLRLYDLTNNPTIAPNKDGVLDIGSMNEGYDEASFHMSSEINGNSFYEF